MKRYLIAGVIILIFLGLFVLILFKLLAPTQPTPNSVILPGAQNTSGAPGSAQAPATPDTVASTCYKWYISTLKKPGAQTGVAYSDAINNCFSSDFVASWPTGENLDSDPVILAQDYQASWLSSITSTVLRQNAQTSEVVTRLGSGSTEKDLDLTLTNTSAGWRISNIQLAH